MGSTRVRELNDAFRSTLIGGRVVVTSGVQKLPPRACGELLARVRSFSNFAKGNDPHEERDFGSIEFQDETYFWKIDYYDRTLEGASPDPADPSVTTRVLTIMRSDEY